MRRRGRARSVRRVRDELDRSGFASAFSRAPDRAAPSRVAPRSVLALLEISMLGDLAWPEDFSNLYPTLGSCPNIIFFQIVAASG